MTSLPRQRNAITADDSSVESSPKPVAHGECADHDIPPHHRTRCGALAIALLGLPVLGCQAVMSNPNQPPSLSDLGTLTVVPNEFPLRFQKHNFEAHCYNTRGCSVVYYDTVHAKNDPEEPPLQSSGDYRKNWGGASEIGIPNFPKPAAVKWRSMDGTQHEEEVDIGGIFKDELILHNVPQEEIPVETAATIGGPEIILEVNDRTINVYMKVWIALKDTATRKSDFRSELILAWSKTY